jgi:hypothetical protein
LLWQLTRFKEEEEVEVVVNPPPCVIKPLPGYRVIKPKAPPAAPRPYTRANTLREIQTVTSCLLRNHTRLQQLRDDHQLNMKQEKEIKVERRKEKREKKAQELADIEEEVSGIQKTFIMYCTHMSHYVLCTNQTERRQKVKNEQNE